jgi:pyrroline-5-carboxylate reductase
MPRASLGFIGAGNMAEAIVNGVLRSGLYTAAQILAADPSSERRALFAGLGISAVAETAHVAANSEILILAVKPQMIGPAIEQIRPVLPADTLVISIIAGLSSAFLETSLAGGGDKLRVLRVMPNTPMLVGAGMSAVCPGRNSTAADLDIAERIFAAGGKTVRVTESQMDAVTATSGSGPAYVFLLVEAMAAAGAQLGLSPEHAATLARQTIVGAARLLDESADTPTELRRKVTSPKGTTLAAIESFEKQNFAHVVLTAMSAAAARSKELGK